MATLEIKKLPQAFSMMTKEMQKAALKGALSGALRAVPIIQRATMKAKAVNTGAFMRGWRARRHKLGAEVYNTAPHAAYVEEGRKPGARMPPPDVIAKWSKRVKIKLGRGKARISRESLGFLIARAIAKRGIKAKNVRKRAWHNMATAVEVEVHKAIMEYINKDGFGAARK
jgi:hypothetical protein